MTFIIHRSWESFRGTLPGTFSGNLSWDLWEPFWELFRESRKRRTCCSSMLNVGRTFWEPFREPHGSRKLFAEHYGHVLSCFRHHSSGTHMRNVHVWNKVCVTTMNGLYLSSFSDSVQYIIKNVLRSAGLFIKSEESSTGDMAHEHAYWTHSHAQAFALQSLLPN